MKRLSFIVPIYNVEPYIERCLRSLEDQNIPMEQYEIICINDGSPDDSRGVVIQMQNEFKNIILIEQENQGVSVARNSGIDIAKGEYIVMVDADDFIKPNILKNKLSILEKNDLDIGFSGYIILNESFKEEYAFDPVYDPNNVLSGIEYFNKFLRGKTEIREPHSSCSHFFKTSYLNSNNLRYLAEVPFLEDGELMARVVCLANRVVFINEPYYMRTIRPGSASQSKVRYSGKARDGFLKAARNLLEFKFKYCKTEDQKVFMNQAVIQFTILFLSSFERLNYILHYSEIYNSLKKSTLKQLETNGCSDFYAKMGRFYNYSIHSFYINWYLHIIRLSIKIKINRFFILITKGHENLKNDFS